MELREQTLDTNASEEQILEEALKTFAIGSWSERISNLKDEIVPRLFEIKKKMLQLYL